MLDLTKCGKCGKIYTDDEYSSLQKVKVVEDDPDPMENYGFTHVCTCGYVFHNDAWQVSGSFKIETKKGTVKGVVLTIFLETGYGTPDKPLWYETMLRSIGPDIEDDLHERYETLEEAQIGHAKVLKALRSGNYKIEPKQWFLTITEELLTINAE